TGKPLAPKLPPPPIEGPVVDFTTSEAKKADIAAPAGCLALIDRKGRRVGLGTQGRGHLLMSGPSMVEVGEGLRAGFENILDAKITTKPVEIVTPFPWHGRKGKDLAPPLPGPLPEVLKKKAGG